MGGIIILAGMTMVVVGILTGLATNFSVYGFWIFIGRLSVQEQLAVYNAHPKLTAFSIGVVIAGVVSVVIGIFIDTH